VSRKKLPSYLYFDGYSLGLSDADAGLPTHARCNQRRSVDHLVSPCTFSYDRASSLDPKIRWCRGRHSVTSGNILKSRADPPAWIRWPRCENTRMRSGDRGSVYHIQLQSHACISSHAAEGPQNYTSERSMIEGRLTYWVTRWRRQGYLLRYISCVHQAHRHQCYRFPATCNHRGGSEIM
jgi:hypothetical protein